MTVPLFVDPSLTRALELIDKHRPETEASLWLLPPGAALPSHHTGWRFWQPHFQARSQLLSSGWPDVDVAPFCIASSDKNDSLIDPSSKSFKAWPSVVVFASKSKEETFTHLQLANLLLDDRGILLFVCPNDYGAKSYEQPLKECGATAHYENGRKSRLYTLKKHEGFHHTSPVGPQKIMEGFWSAPGLFSWSKIDQGSKLLAQCLRQEELIGPVADFGAGYGYLATQLQPRLTVHLFEEDLRGLVCAQHNLANRRNTFAHWCDLSDLRTWPAGAPETFATIITNPPFHTGKKDVAALGQLFAILAHRRLSPGGCLWLVGNTHLGYPRFLQSLFQQVEVRAQHEGFTIVKAIK